MGLPLNREYYVIFLFGVLKPRIAPLVPSTFPQVSRQLTSTDTYGETAVMLSVRSGSPAVFRSVIGRLSEDEVKIHLMMSISAQSHPAAVFVTVLSAASVELSVTVCQAWPILPRKERNFLILLRFNENDNLGCGEGTFHRCKCLLFLANFVLIR